MGADGQASAAGLHLNRADSDESLVQVEVQQGRGEAGTAQEPKVGLERQWVLVVPAARVHEVVG
jgi:hypothetical protein